MNKPHHNTTDHNPHLVNRSGGNPDGDAPHRDDVAVGGPDDACRTCHEQYDRLLADSWFGYRTIHTAGDPGDVLGYEQLVEGPSYTPLLLHDLLRVGFARAAVTFQLSNTFVCVNVTLTQLPDVYLAMRTLAARQRPVFDQLGDNGVWVKVKDWHLSDPNDLILTALAAMGCVMVADFVLDDELRALPPEFRVVTIPAACLTDLDDMIRFRHESLRRGVLVVVEDITAVDVDVQALLTAVGFTVVQDAEIISERNVFHQMCLDL